MKKAVNNNCKQKLLIEVFNENMLIKGCIHKLLATDVNKIFNDILLTKDVNKSFNKK